MNRISTIRLPLPSTSTTPDGKASKKPMAMTTPGTTYGTISAPSSTLASRVSRLTTR